MANLSYKVNGSVDLEINIPCVTCAGTPSHTREKCGILG